MWLRFGCWRHSLWTNLCGCAEAGGTFTGSHHQQVPPLVTLIIQRSGQTDLSRLLLDTEKATWIDEQAVADRLLLKGNGRHHQETVEQEHYFFFWRSRKGGTWYFPFRLHETSMKIKFRSPYISTALMKSITTMYGPLTTHHKHSQSLLVRSGAIMKMSVFAVYLEEPVFSNTEVWRRVCSRMSNITDTCILMHFTTDKPNTRLMSVCQFLSLPLCRNLGQWPQIIVVLCLPPRRSWLHMELPHFPLNLNPYK